VAEPAELRDGPGKGNGSTGREGPGRESRIPRVLGGGQPANRVALYWFILLLLLVGSTGPLNAAWNSSPETILVLETSAALLAFAVGALSLVRFYSRKQGTFLFIGTGFLGTGLLDLIHAWMAFADRAGLPDRGFGDRSAWSFTASGTFLSLFLLVSWIAWRREALRGIGQRIRERTAYVVAALLTLVVLVGFELMQGRRAIYPENFITHPAEFLPALLFLLALLGFLSKGRWREDVFEHWLVLAILMNVMAHGAYMPFARAPYDLDFTATHGLKVLSYASVLIGLMASVFTIFRREEEAAQAAQEANAALAREIDTRRKAERILTEHEQQLQDFLDNAHDLIQSLDPEGRFLYVNRAWKEALGYTDQDLEHMNFFQVLHPSCRESCSRDFLAVLHGEDLPELEVTFVSKEGQLVTCSGSANARFENGEAVATRAIFRDISEPLEARRELEAFQANLQALVENTGDAIWSVNRNLELLTFNTAFSMALEARTGREPEASKLPEEVFPPGDARWYREMYLRSLKGNAFSELRDEEIGGQIRSYELFFNPIREAMGITGVAVFSKDVTARRRTQLALRMAKEEAERANQAKSQFLANMSHELRTPLNSVIGFTNILRKNRSGALEEKELGFLERISANGRHLLDLINEVLDLAKIEAGRMELEIQATDLGELIRETLGQMEGQVREKDLTLKARIPEGLRALETDPGKVRQVLINLVGNAVKFTEEGEIFVEVDRSADGDAPSVIRVRDTGIGIPEERLQAIFEAFQQADGTTTRRFGGTGLGLTISRSLCQLMGFDLKVESTVGKGSVFSILLTDVPDGGRRAEAELMEEALRPIESSRPDPRMRDVQPAPALPEAPESSALEEEGTHRVLVIDDDPDSRALLSHFLEDLGCLVRTAASAGEGLHRAKAWNPDLITLDLMMPGVSGWEALKRFKDDPDLRNIPVVIISVMAGEGEFSNLVGAVDLLTKPVAREDLFRVLDRNLPPDRDRVVLLVEDDPDTQTVMESYLDEAGLDVVLASNGREAEERLERMRPDIILLDLMMPEMDGMTFLNRLRERRKEISIPVVICTGKELSLDEKNRLRAQASGIVVKGKGFEKDLKEILSRFFPLKEDDGKG